MPIPVINPRGEGLIGARGGHFLLHYQNPREVEELSGMIVEVPFEGWRSLKGKVAMGGLIAHPKSWHTVYVAPLINNALTPNFKDHL